MKRGVLLPGLLVLLAGCNRSDPEILARIGKMTGAKLTEALPTAERVRAGFSFTQGDPAERVRMRLKSDRYIADTAIEVESSEEGVHIRGQVSDAGLRQRILELAASTTGVRKVIDELTAE